MRPIEEDVIAKLAQLQVIRFKLKHPTEYREISDTTDMNLIANELLSEKYTKDRIGLIAQELQLNFPEVVKESNDGFLKVNYQQLIPVLVKAITLQQQHINSLEEELNEIKKVEDTKSSMAISMSKYNQVANSNAILYQNQPNPFNLTTVIKYYLPESISSAQIKIYDLQGEQVLNHDINSTGEGSLKIQASQLNPGVYIYSLVAVNGYSDSKQMVITD